MAHEVAVRGVPSVTVARVIARAGVQRRIFYELFSNIESCFLGAFDWAVEQAGARARVAYEAEANWAEGVRAGLAALLRFLDEEPLLAQLCIVHATAGGPRVLARRSQVIEQLSVLVDRGRAQRGVSREPASIVAEGAVGAILAVLHSRLLARGAGAAAGYAAPSDEQQPLIELHGQLASMVFLPYLGARAAARELERAPPSPPPAPVEAAPAGSVATASADIPQGRLTYRTVRVLHAIAECPSASNREVAERSGIVDQGQISKILARLQEQGLAVNRMRGERGRGMPNAWWLTERGHALERTLRDFSGARQPGKGSGSRRPAM